MVRVVLATTADVEAVLGETLSTPPTALLDEASDLIIGFLGCDPSDPGPTPGPVVRVVARMVARVIERGTSGADEATQVGQTVGPFSQQVSYADGTRSGGPWLSASDKMRLRPYRCGGLVSVPLAGDHTGRYRRY